MRYLLFVAILTALTIAQGCGGAPRPANVAATPAPASTPAVQKLETANIDLPAATETRPQTGDSIAERARRSPRAEGNPERRGIEPEFREAPEDSRVSIVMGRDGVVREVREFRSHSLLQRVESTWTGHGPRDLTVTLHGRKAVRFRTEAISDLATVSAERLISLVERGRAN